MRVPKTYSIALLGGSFDPPHIGHLRISKQALRILPIKKLYWVVTKKNPFKGRPFYDLENRIKKCVKMVRKVKKIEIIYLDKKIKSSRTVNVINFFKSRVKSKKIFFIMGSDTLINFHKWRNYRKIISKCKLVVFSRTGYDKKALNSLVTKKWKKNIIFLKNKRFNVSSTMIRNKLSN